MKGKILLIDTLHPSFKSSLEQQGFVCDEGYAMSKDEILSIIKDYNGVAIRSRFKIDADFISKASHLKFIARGGAGMENIDAAAAATYGINLINAPEGNRDAVGEHAIGMLLAMMNHLIRVDKEVRLGIWKREENRGDEIQGKTIGIIGFGNMGTAFAKKLQGFEVNMLVSDPYIHIDPQQYPYVQQVSIDTIFEQADIISLHVPLTSETNKMVNVDFLSKFKKPIRLINTARGKVVDTAALTEAMENGSVISVALDVLEYEAVSFENLDAASLPEPFQYLIKSDRAILSPHIGGWTHESNEKIALTMANKIIQLFN
jgi:D-3-phosphoglycerate dehydrogenase